MLTLEDWTTIRYLTEQADLRSNKASTSNDYDEAVLLRGESIGIRQMIIDLMDGKHKKDASAD